MSTWTVWFSWPAQVDLRGMPWEDGLELGGCVFGTSRSRAARRQSKDIHVRGLIANPAFLERQHELIRAESNELEGEN